MNENIVIKDMEAEYDNSGRVENSSQLISDFTADAADYRNEAAKLIDFGQSYGPKERNKLDLFWPGNDKPDKSAPIVVFIHGGYWQRLDRAAFSHMAKGLNAHGIAVAIPSYTLCPNITISGIIDEIRRACIVLWKTYDRTITVCGHSAGGHLAACMMATNWNRIHNSLPDDLVQSALSISGVFDLAPLIETSLNEALKITPEEARTASPYNWIIDHDARFDAWVGGDESPEFLRQSRSQAQRWQMMGAKTRYQEVAGANHFTAVAPLTDPKSPMVLRLLELLNPAETATLEDLKIPDHQPMPIDKRDTDQSSDELVEDDDPKSGVPKADAPQPDAETEQKSIEKTPDETNEDTDDSIDAAKDTAEKAAVADADETGEQTAKPADDVAAQPDQTEEAPSPEAAEFQTDPEVADSEPEVEAIPSTKTLPVNDEKKPDVASQPENGGDNLTFISRIDDKTENRLNELGFSTYAQIAELSETQQEMIEDILELDGRIQAEHWITQARHQQALKEMASE